MTEFTDRARAELTMIIRAVTDNWDEPLDEVHDVPQIVNAILASAWQREQDPTEEELSHTHREVAESMTKMWQSERERADRLAEKLTDDPTEDEIEAAAMAIFAEHEPAYFHQKVHTKAWNVLMDQFRDAARAALLAVRDVRKEQGR